MNVIFSGTVDGIWKKICKFAWNKHHVEDSRPKIMMESTLKNDVCNWLYIYNSKVLRKNFYPIKINQNLKDNTATITLREK